jgi:hypothetical protein
VQQHNHAKGAHRYTELMLSMLEQLDGSSSSNSRSTFSAADPILRDDHHQTGMSCHCMERTNKLSQDATLGSGFVFQGKN